MDGAGFKTVPGISDKNLEGVLLDLLPKYNLCLV
jgi:hypothetical protein